MDSRRETVLVSAVAGRERAQKAKPPEIRQVPNDFERLMTQAELKGLTGKESDITDRLEKIAVEMSLSNENGWLSKLVAENMRARVI